jgi:PAS domain S-box-containing protein
MALALGAAMPGPGSQEAELLRRLRSFSAAALQHGAAATPALDGLRVAAARAARLTHAFVDAAAAIAGPDGPAVREALDPIAQRFLVTVRGTAPARNASGAPRRSNRRAVSAAIDRVSDAFLAIDVETGRIADANPAAGAMLGLPRDQLVGADALDHVPEAARQLWWTHLEALSEGDDGRRFETRLRDREGRSVGVEARVTRFATRTRTLALVLVRPS